MSGRTDGAAVALNEAIGLYERKGNMLAAERARAFSDSSRDRVLHPQDAFRDLALPARTGSRSRASRRPSSRRCLAPHHDLVRAAAAHRPDADLVAVRIDGDARVVLRREHQQPHGRVAAVRELVGAVRAFREAHDLAGLHLLLAVGRSDGDRPLEHEQPLLVGVLVVVGAVALARP